MISKFSHYMYIPFNPIIVLKYKYYILNAHVLRHAIKLQSSVDNFAYSLTVLRWKSLWLRYVC